MSFKLIDKGYTGLDYGSSEPADLVSSFDLGYLTLEQTKRLAFRIANTGTAETNYKVSASGENTSLNAAMEFSTDGVEWQTEVFHSGVQANSVSDLVEGRLTIPDDAYLTSGTVLIQISEVV